MTRIELILQQVAEVHEIDLKEMLSKKRSEWLVNARFQAFVILREAGYSLARIGRSVGKRDHSTVIHGLEMHEDFMFKDKDYKALFERVKAVCRPRELTVTYINQNVA